MSYLIACDVVDCATTASIGPDEAIPLSWREERRVLSSSVDEDTRTSHSAFGRLWQISHICPAHPRAACKDDPTPEARA